MKSRPGIIILLALFNFLGPIPSLLISAYLSNLSISQYVTYRLHSDPISFLLGALVLNILTAVAIFSMKKWSLPVCVAITLWDAVHSSNLFQHYDNTFTAPTIALCYVINLAIIAYFLSPPLRRAYADRSLHWWKSEVRYKANLPGKVWIRSSNQECRISEISRRGIFVKIERILGVGEDLDLEFGFEDQTYSLKGKVLHRNAVHHAYGIHFTNLNRATKREIHHLLRRFDSSGIQRNPERVNGYVEFKKWLSGFVRSGKGFIPQLETAEEDKREIKQKKEKSFEKAA